MVEALFRKSLGALRPADDEAAELLSKIKDGDTLKVSWIRPRNDKQHRLYFELCKVVAENTEGYSKDHIDKIIRIGVGHYDLIPLPCKPGQIPRQLPVERSLSYAAMDRDQFTVYLDKAINYILTTILPVARADLEREVFERIGIPLPESGAATKPGGSAAGAGPATPALPPELERKEMT